jgi:D-alanine-D-alanine ligase
MKIAVIHGEVAEGAGRDEQDVLTQVDFISRGLSDLGHEPVAVPVSLNLEAAALTIAGLRPAIAFNLAETLAGKGRLIHVVPALLDALNIPYTGATTEAMLLTSNKLLAKRWLAAAGLPTPPWFTGNETDPIRADDSPFMIPLDNLRVDLVRPGGTRGGKTRHKLPPAAPGLPKAKAWLIKSVWEHASIGLDEDSVLFGADRKRLVAEMDVRREALGGACLAEAYIDGREFNLSLLARGQRPAEGRLAPAARGTLSPSGEMSGPENGAGTDCPLPDDAFLMDRSGQESGPGHRGSIPVCVCGPEVLPPAEIRFDAYPPGKVRVVGYRSKWEEGSFEFANTPRTFDFPAQDAALLAQLTELALRCWRLFDLRGYARVDFRVDGEGRPWILEVNANPCLSPDAGFCAAALRAGLNFPTVLTRIIGGVPHA